MVCLIFAISDITMTPQKQITNVRWTSDPPYLLDPLQLERGEYKIMFFMPIPYSFVVYVNITLAHRN